MVGTRLVARRGRQGGGNAACKWARVVGARVVGAREQGGKHTGLPGLPQPAERCSPPSSLAKRNVAKLSDEGCTPLLGISHTLRARGYLSAVGAKRSYKGCIVSAGDVCHTLVAGPSVPTCCGSCWRSWGSGHTW